MTARHITAVAMYVAAAATTVGCAVAWGPGGQLTVLLICVVTFLFATIGTVQTADSPPASKTPPTGTTPGA